DDDPEMHFAAAFALARRGHRDIAQTLEAHLDDLPVKAMSAALYLSRWDSPAGWKTFLRLLRDERELLPHERLGLVEICRREFGIQGEETEEVFKPAIKIIARRIEDFGATDTRS